ncbi:MAG: single-stranded-DNA-specific exonuclease RecJ, partial [Gammaproteobacteria bacterium]
MRQRPEIRRRRARCAPPQGVPELLARIYAHRGLGDEAETDLSLGALLPVQQLTGADEAARLLADVLESDGRILVAGDFDADGATASALAVRGLKALGASDVHYLVPDRFAFGYGLSPELVAVAAARDPDLIVTVDNGISSIEGVKAAREAGIRVLVTDHHLPGAVLPAADAIVNPNLPGNGFPSRHLAGVGVMFYVLAALRSELRERGWFARRGLTEPNLARWLDLVALGTVADVVSLDRNNRILVEQGL